MARHIWAKIFRLLALWKKKSHLFSAAICKYSTMNLTNRVNHFLSAASSPILRFTSFNLQIFLLLFFYTYKHLFPPALALFFPFTEEVNYKRWNNKRAIVVIMVGRGYLSLDKKVKFWISLLWEGCDWWRDVEVSHVDSSRKDLDCCGCGEGRRWNRKFLKQELIGCVAKSMQFGSEKTNYWSRGVFIRAPRDWN